MTLTDVYNRLKLIKDVPVAYLAFKSAQNSDYIVYYESGANFHGSDERNHIKEMNVTIELYTDKKNRALEKRIEDLFSDVELSKGADAWIDDEQMLMVTYEFMTINKE
ncbi:MAG: hypothetical protein Q4F95_07450 [Oscillospiraceae bacterium]|nr:hypothetical protein [Oscillospiraceae bacterium]